MKPEPDYDELLNEALAGDNPGDLRASSLQRTLSAVRRRRRLQRAAGGACAVAACAILAGLVWHEHASPRIAANRQQPATAVPAVAQTVPGTNIRLVSDEELLAMFPDRPVALVGPPEDRRFVFLDEQRNAEGHRTTGKALNL